MSKIAPHPSSRPQNGAFAIIKRLLAHNFWLKLSSCIIAVFLWLYVQYDTAEPHVSTHSFKMTLPDPPADYVITSQKTYDINLKATGPRELTPAEIDKLSATVDLSNVQIGRNRCVVEFTPPPGLGSGWTWELSRNVIWVEIDKVQVAVKDIVLETRGLTKPYLVYTGATLQPLKTEIRGAGAKVQSVKQVRASLDLSTAEPGNSYVVKLEPLNAQGKPVADVTCDPSEVAVRPALIPAPTHKYLVVTPMWSGQPALGYRLVDAQITPNQVEVTGRSEVLARLVAIETEPLQLDGLKESATLRTTLKIPAGVKVEPNTVVQVRVRIEPIPTRSE